MGRLIDTDKLDGYILTKHGESNKVLCSKSIANVPTAYDVEAVVKELEELKQIEINDECPIDLCGDCECSKYKCKGCYTSKAIEIVRKGGVSNE